MADFKLGDHVNVNTGSGRRGVVYGFEADGSIRVVFPDIHELRPFHPNELEHALDYDVYSIKVELFRNGVLIAEEEDTPAATAVLGEIAESMAEKVVKALSPDKKMFTTGVFGMTLNGELFVVANDRLIYQKCGWDRHNSTLIAVLVEASSFDLAKTRIEKDKNIIWTSPLYRAANQ